MWRHDMDTVSVLLTLREGIQWSPVDSPKKSSVMENFDVFLDWDAMTLMWRQWNVVT